MSVNDSDPRGDSPTDLSPAENATVDDSANSGLGIHAADTLMPKTIGRYFPRKVIGHAGFGVVYLAFDEELRREVAIKVPRADRIQRAEDIQLYLTEAQMVAGLDHENIVPVHDFGRTDDGMCFMVSKLIDGVDLATKISQQSLSPRTAAKIVVAIADALHHAHTRRPALVHRDVKPGNILIDHHGKPYLTDFGLAIKEEEFGKAAAFAGTVPYMSPEQARWEGHRVDGRSDIFSLGSVFYELLTGKQPFSGYNKVETLERIKFDEPRPPRQRDDRIPKELERVCLKALAKRVSDRYLTALDMAEDIRQWLADVEPGNSLPTSTDSQSDRMAVAASDQAILVRPKGLRSFDSGDADFFMELLPGPRDRAGVPESILFWKHRMESTDASEAFRVGVTYGPSGCGKSSLVKAGLLPLLDPGIAVIYTEATARGTDTRLLHLLGTRFSELLRPSTLADALAKVRRGSCAAATTKVLIVLDQFEQWIHNRDHDENHALLDALRQCDGCRVQALLIVRDDFWMGISRVMHDLEIPMSPGDNVAAVDLFGRRHARKVLRSFGSSLGALPSHDNQLTDHHHQFLDEAIDQLAEDNKISPVRLAFFTEMVKDRAWSPTSLRELGGAAGVGIAFLEDIFSGPSANPQHRVHELAARRVLAALLPNDGGIIKGRMRSYKDLRTISGYESSGGEFDSLLRMLDNDLRLITPTESGAFAAESEDQSASTSDSDRYYHLTHDHLVPALTDWLQQKQRETPRGRALILLDEQVAIWSRQRHRRQLPSLVQWLRILAMTRRVDRRAYSDRRKLLSASAQHHGRRMLIATAATLVLILVGLNWNGSSQATAHVNALTTARITDVPTLVDKIGRYARWADPMLSDVHTNHSPNSPQRLRADLALAPRHARHRDALTDWLWVVDPESFLVICDAMKQSTDKTRFQQLLLRELADPDNDPERQFRAAAAVVRFQRRDQSSAINWDVYATRIADHLLWQLDRQPSSYAVWQPSFAKIREFLIAPLRSMMNEPDRDRSQRNLAATLLAEYAADRPGVLVELALDADASQYARLKPALARHRDRVLSHAESVLARPDDPSADDQVSLQQSRKQAHAAATLIHFGRQSRAWPLLIAGRNNTRRSQLIQRINTTGTDLSIVQEQLESETNPSIRASLALVLGQSDTVNFRATEYQRVIAILRRLFEQDPSCAVHSSAEWSLSRWGDLTWLGEARQRLARENPQPGFQWYVTPEQITMTVVHGPVTVSMGSPENESGHEADETIRTRTVQRSFAVATTEVTKKQFLEFVNQVMPGEFRHADNEFIPEPDCPMNAVSWFEAARFCRWLTERAGIDDNQNCFPSDQAIHSRMSLPENFLERIGYRLPTEAEWEYVGRAATETKRYFGNDPALLPDYVWYLPNSNGRTRPVARLRPNDMGCFDMLGNVHEWCHDRYQRNPSTDGDDTDHRLKVNRDLRVSKGGGFSATERTLRAANRADVPPLNPSTSRGFRLARTLKPTD